MSGYKMTGTLKKDKCTDKYTWSPGSMINQSFTWEAQLEPSYVRQTFASIYDNIQMSGISAFRQTR